MRALKALGSASGTPWRWFFRDRGHQNQDFWFMIIPPTVSQYESYSDIEERVVNYDRLMLDMDKEWLMQRLQMQKMQFNS